MTFEHCTRADLIVQKVATDFTSPTTFATMTANPSNISLGAADDPMKVTEVAKAIAQEPAYLALEKDYSETFHAYSCFQEILDATYAPRRPYSPQDLKELTQRKTAYNEAGFALSSYQVQEALKLGVSRVDSIFVLRALNATNSQFPVEAPPPVRGR